ncbi:MAG: RdgB/HAM1 family non-canonical purine NTP pyrophosphatase [Chitinophagaceae bacterium]
MTTLIFATNNKHKLEEMQLAIGHLLTVVSLQDAGITIDIPEPHDTLEANASEKSRTIYKLTGQYCFSDDSGLEVEALNGEPGVKSARYAGEDNNFARNVAKLLTKLGDNTNRKARFRTVISLIWQGQEHFFEGICEGEIIHHPRGEHGFGYDPVFVPAGSMLTFAEMSMEQKNLFSHRKRAAEKLVAFLQQQLANA